MARTKQAPLKSFGACKSARRQIRTALPDKSLTPVHRAAIGGKVSILMALLKRRQADIDKRDYYDHCTALHYAVRNSHPRAVGILLAHGASVSAEDRASRTPLALAAQQGHVKTFNLVLDQGASVSSVCKNGRTPLHYASSGGHLAIARILLEKGVSITVQDKDRWTALDHAVYNRHWDVVEMFLKEGRHRWASCQSQRQCRAPPPDAADDDALVLELREGTKTNHNERMLAAGLATCLGLDNLLVRLFNEHGCHPDATIRGGVVPLVHAAENGHQTRVEVLLAHGADVNGVERADANPLRCALRRRHDAVVSVLLDAGASPLSKRQDQDSAKGTVVLLAERGPSVAAQFLSQISSLDLLSVWLVEIAASKFVTLLEEYFRVVAPTVRGKYTHQPDLPPTTELIHLLVQSQGRLSTTTAEANSTRPWTRSSTRYSQHLRQTTVAALEERFVGVFFLLAVVDRKVLSEVLTDLPHIREQAQQKLPSRLNREMDKELISRLAQAGYTFPAPPPPAFHDICEVGSAHEVQGWPETEGTEIVSMAGLRDRTPSLWTFHNICEVGRAHEVQWQLRIEGKGIINMPGVRNRTSLHVAAQAGNLEVVKLLVENDADLTATTFRGTTAEKLAQNFNRGAVAAFLKAEREKVEGGGAGAGARRTGSTV